jgi:hypothetical protein
VEGVLPNEFRCEKFSISSREREKLSKSLLSESIPAMSFRCVRLLAKKERIFEPAEKVLLQHIHVMLKVAVLTQFDSFIKVRKTIFTVCVCGFTLPRSVWEKEYRVEPSSSSYIINHCSRSLARLKELMFRRSHLAEQSFNLPMKNNFSVD